MLKSLSSGVQHWHETQACWICPWLQGQLCSFKVPCSCYRYSNSKAWCRAMRSEWLETLQKGIACCRRVRHMVRSENAPSTSPSSSFEIHYNSHPLVSVLWKLPAIILISHLFKKKFILNPPQRTPDWVLKCNLESTFFKKVMDISQLDLHVTPKPIPNFEWNCWKQLPFKICIQDWLCWKFKKLMFYESKQFSLVGSTLHFSKCNLAHIWNNCSFT
jgi:hypothetical protein